MAPYRSTKIAVALKVLDRIRGQRSLMKAHDLLSRVQGQCAQPAIPASLTGERHSLIPVDVSRARPVFPIPFLVPAVFWGISQLVVGDWNLTATQIGVVLPRQGIMVVPEAQEVAKAKNCIGDLATAGLIAEALIGMYKCGAFFPTMGGERKRAENPKTLILVKTRDKNSEPGRPLRVRWP